MKRGGELKRTRLNPVSDKRIAERPKRDAVRAATIARANGQCEGRVLVPEVQCSRGDLEVHEKAQRSICPGSHLRLDLTMALCRAHHAYCDENVAEAHDRGLLTRSWQVPPAV